MKDTLTLLILFKQYVFFFNYRALGCITYHHQVHLGQTLNYKQCWDLKGEYFKLNKLIVLNPPICDPPLYITVTCEPIMLFSNSFWFGVS